MANDETGICNLALMQIGHETISGLNEQSKAGRFCARFYPKTRDAVLRAGRWPFAKARVALAQLTAVPAFKYAAYFALPNDFLRVLTFDSTQIDYSLESVPSTGQLAIASNEANMNLIYIRQVTDPNKFDPLFVDALAARLATDLSGPLARSPDMAERLWKLYRSKVEEARAASSQESTGPDYPDETGWLDARDGMEQIGYRNWSPNY